MVSWSSSKNLKYVIQFYFYNSDVEKYTLHIIYLKDNNTVWTANFVPTQNYWPLMVISKSFKQNRAEFYYKTQNWYYYYQPWVLLCLAWNWYRLGAIFILCKDIGVGGPENGNFPLHYIVKCPYVGGWVVQKSLKTPLRNIKMAPNFDFSVLYFLKMCPNFDFWYQIKPNG